MKYVLFFGETGVADIDLIGKKGVNLSLLLKKGYKVPPGFIISKEVFDTIKENKEVKNMLDNYRSSKDDSILRQIYAKIRKYEFSEDIMDEIIEAYLSLSVDVNMNVDSMLKSKEEFVAVRSCVVGENVSIGISHKTVLNIKGQERLFNAIKESYAANFILELKNDESTKLSFGVIIQKMIDSVKSGVAYSHDSKNPGKIVIKAVFGLGEGIRTGNVFPDTYLVDKKTNEVESTDVAEKQFEYTRDIETNETVKYRLGEKSLKQVLFDNEINEVSRITKKIVNEFGSEQKVSWAIKGEVIYVIQTKSIDGNFEKEDTVELEILGDESDDEVPDVIDISEPDIEDDLEALDEIEQIEQGEPVDLEKEPEQEIEVIDLDEQHIKEEKVDEDGFSESQVENLFDNQSVEEESVDEEPTEEKPIETKPIEEEPPSYALFGMPEEDDEEETGYDEDESEIDETNNEEPAVLDEEIESLTEDNKKELVEEIVKTDESNDALQQKDDEEDSIFSDYKDFERFNVTDEPVVNKPVLSKTKELALLNAGNTVVYCHMVVKEKLMDRLRKYTSEVPKEFEKIIDELTQYEPVENEEGFRKINKVRNDFVDNNEYPTADDVGLSLRLI